MYNKHEHFRQVKDVYNLAICMTYAVSKAACLCIDNLFGHIISICAELPIN